MRRNKKYGYEQQQEQIQSTAYDKKITHDMFKMTMRWLEKYIEIAYGKEFPDWESRKQIRDNVIQRQDIIGNPEIAEETFSTQLFLFESTAKTKSPAILEELKQEFYQWISAVNINSNECPERLKHFLFGINEILEGRGGKIQKDIENRRKIFDPTSPEYMKGMMSLFASTRTPAREEIEVEKSLRGKIDKDIGVESNFSGGNIDQGRNVFDQISKGVAGGYENFHCVPQKNQQIRNPNYNALIDDPSEEFLTSNSLAASSNQELDEFQQARRFLIDDIKQNANEFELKPVLTFNGHRYDAINKRWTRYGKEKQETMLVHKSAQITENDYNEFGYLPIQNDKMFQESRFSQAEWAEIQKALKSSQKEQVSRHHQTQTDNNRKGGSGGAFGGHGSSILFGSFSVISLIGLAFTKK